jgi:hypothetical protein
MAMGVLTYATTLAKDHSLEVMGLFEALKDWGTDI